LYGLEELKRDLKGGGYGRPQQHGQQAIEICLPLIFHKKGFTLLRFLVLDYIAREQSFFPQPCTDAW
jgi:hypothetical protein